jgi:hypothetical protein
MQAFVRRQMLLYSNYGVKKHLFNGKIIPLLRKKEYSKPVF